MSWSEMIYTAWHHLKFRVAEVLRLYLDVEDKFSQSRVEKTPIRTIRTKEESP